jgi:hypothetical protein
VRPVSLPRVPLAYQPPANSTFLSERISHQQPQYFSLRTNQHQLPSTSQLNRLLAYQPPVSSTFLSQQTSYQQSATNTFLSKQTSTSHRPPAMVLV